MVGLADKDELLGVFTDDHRNRSPGTGIDRRAGSMRPELSSEGAALRRIRCLKVLPCIRRAGILLAMMKKT